MDDVGRWYADAAGRPALVHGCLRIHACAGDDPVLMSAVRARSRLIRNLADDLGLGTQARRTATLVLASFEPDAPDSGATMAEIGRRIRPMLRRRDLFLPYAANRFAIALASCPSSEAEAAGKRLAALLDGCRPPLPRLRLGIACAPDHARDPCVLLRLAEEALAAAAPGGQRIALFRRRHQTGERPAPGTSAEDLIAALNGRRLVLAASPARDPQTGLAAFLDTSPRPMATGGTLPARDIAASAERNGLSLLLDGRTLELSCDYLVLHPQERVAIPIAAATLADPAWLDMLAAHLGARPGIASRLIVKVHERAVLDPSSRGRLDAMKALGVAIMLTGFGAGHVALGHLHSLPVDLVRLNGAFVQSLGRSVDDRLLCRRLVDLAHHLGLAVVAAGVCDEAAARHLAAWGVDYLANDAGTDLSRHSGPAQRSLARDSTGLLPSPLRGGLGWGPCWRLIRSRVPLTPRHLTPRKAEESPGA